MSKSSSRRFIGGLFGWILFLILGGSLVYVFGFETYHFAVVQDGVLYRMGMRDTLELNNAIRRVHPRTVVCLVTDKEINDPSKGEFQGEFAILKKDAITLDRIPIIENETPTPSQIDEFLRIVTDRNNQPVIVHCAQGVIRTGMMVAVYDKDVLGYTRQQALDAVQIFGKGADRGETVRRFINQYYDQPIRQVAATQ